MVIILYLSRWVSISAHITTVEHEKWGDGKSEDRGEWEQGQRVCISRMVRCKYIDVLYMYILW